MRGSPERPGIWRLNTDNLPTFQEFCAAPIAAGPEAAGRHQGKEKGRGRRSGLFPVDGQREEVLASPGSDGRRVSLREYFFSA
jgi:hypothetical protein